MINRVSFGEMSKFSEQYKKERQKFFTDLINKPQINTSDLTKPQQAETPIQIQCQPIKDEFVKQNSNTAETENKEKKA